MTKLIISAILLVSIACNCTRTTENASIERYEGPIIDMHLHASFIEDFGGGGSICVNQGKIIFPGADYTEMSLDKLIDCDVEVPASKTNEALMLESIAMLEKHEIYAITSGTLNRVNEWYNRSPERIIRGLSFTASTSKNYSINDYRNFHQSGNLMVFAEIGAQYDGKFLNAPEYDSIWALAQELDIPVGVHLGEGPTGGAHFMGGSPYRVSLGSPFQLEEILIKYPKLRIYVMHYASPLVDEMIGMLFSHPQLYVDIACNVWAFPREHFYSQLQRLINAGFEERIMWGSDQMAWPKTIEVAIETIQNAPFLNREQKKKIFYTNASKFLGFSKETIESHHNK